MKKHILISTVLLLMACNNTYKVSKSYLAGKTFEQKGYAEDQLSPEDIKANPEFAKSHLTSLASIKFIDETKITISYWNYSQGTQASSGTYVIKNNKIVIDVDDLGAILGQKFTLDNAETLQSNGQINEYELKK